MPHRLRKVRKFRGSRTHGWGQVSQHRGGGMRGGRGKTGRQKHKWTHTIKYQPDYFGKKGFKRPQTHKLEKINVGELDEKIESFLSKGLAKKKGKRIILDLRDLGVEKLLGSGNVTRPIFVTAKSWSKNAVKKIEKAEGKIILQT